MDKLPNAQETPVIHAGMTIQSVLRTVKMMPLELRVLLEHTLGFTRVKLITHADHVLTETEAETLLDAVSRRLAGEPVAYIVGTREFYGLPFTVTPDVLIPRPETELLVELSLQCLPERGRLADMGTGSGAIAVSVAAMRPDAEVWASDVSEKALAVARKNAGANLPEGRSVRFLQGSWFDAFSRDDRFDVIVSNPPYSQNWNPTDKETDPRYADYGLAPKGKADYAFLLHDLYHVKSDGIMSIVLPHGVLFRGGEEGEIRKNLIEKDKIDTIIGLPANIFYGTGIPTIIMVLKQKRTNNDFLIIDASKGFVKEGKNNKLRACDIKKIVDTVVNRESIDHFSKVVNKEEIRQNDYNLNIVYYA